MTRTESLEALLETLKALEDKRLSYEWTRGSNQPACALGSYLRQGMSEEAWCDTRAGHTFFYVLREQGWEEVVIREIVRVNCEGGYATAKAENDEPRYVRVVEWLEEEIRKAKEYAHG